MSKLLQACRVQARLWSLKTSTQDVRSFLSLPPPIRTTNSMCEYHTLLSRLQTLSFGSRFPTSQQAQTISQVDVETHHYKLPGFLPPDADKETSPSHRYPGLSELTELSEGIAAYSNATDILEPLIEEPPDSEAELTHDDTLHLDEHSSSTNDTQDTESASNVEVKSLTEKETIILKLLSTSLPEDAERSQEALHNLLETIDHLERHGCPSYQVTEYPAICDLSLEEIDERIERLQALDLPISIPLLGMASMENTNKMMKKITKYMDLNEGHSSVGDFWKEKLNANEEEMLSLAEHYGKRLITKPRKSDVKRQKLDYLLSLDYAPQEIRDYPLVLLNVSLDKLQERVSEFDASGWGKPSLNVLGMSQAKYQRHLRLLKSDDEVGEWDVQEIVENMAELLGEPEENVINIRQYLLTDWSILKEKLVFLLDKGVESSSILLCPKVLRLSHSQLEQAYCDLESLHFEELSLDMIYNYITRGNVHGQQKANTALANWLQLSKEDMKSLKPEIRKRAFLQSSHVISQNIKFLKDRGFTIGDIRQLPIIVCHDSDVLEHHWTSLQEQEDLQPFEQMMERPVVLLNCLQYSIEKEQNFKYSVILSNGKQTE